LYNPYVTDSNDPTGGAAQEISATVTHKSGRLSIGEGVKDIEGGATIEMDAAE
jgi:hypothetical protein